MSTAFATPQTDLERSQGPLEEAAAWEQLKTHLDWSVGLTPVFLFADDQALLQRLRERAVRAVATSGGRSQILLPEDPQALGEVVRTLVTGRKSDLVWLEATSQAPGWAEAWNSVLVRLNQRREELRKTLGGVLVIAAPRALKARFRAIAPDLWSIRATAPEVVAGPQRRDRRAERMNNQLLSEGVRWARYHQEMHAEPWFALIVSEDPAPRRRMREALAAGGLSLVVHPPGVPVAALCRPIEADLHWITVDGPPSPELLELLSRRYRLSKPMLLEGTPSLEALLLAQHPELHQAATFFVRLQDERAVAGSGAAAPDKPFDPQAPLPLLEPWALPEAAYGEPPARGASWSALDRAKALEDELSSLVGRDEGLARSDRVRHLVQDADALLVKGSTSEAAPLAQEALQAASELAPSDPEADWLLAEARELTGRVAHKLGQPDAFRWYHAALEARRRLARTRGRHRLRRRSELARCLSKLGELALKAGHERTAARFIRDALAIRQRLAKQSDDRKTLLDLAMALSLKGDLELALGRAGDRSLTAATEAYRAALRLRKQVADEEDSPQLQRLISVSHGRLADALGRAGDWKSARREASHALVLAQKLLTLSPSHPDLQGEASVAASRLGDCARALGDLPSAAAAWRHEAQLRQALCLQHPDNARLVELWAVAQGRLAETELSLGELDRALQAAQLGLELTSRLTALDPGNHKRLRELGSAWLRLADARSARGDRSQANEAYLQAEQIALRLRDSSEEEDWKASSLLQQLEARGRLLEPAEIR